MQAKPLRRVLIANRGEIALRIIRTCHEMGISTAVVYSDADADTPAVELADVAVRIGPAPASQSYLAIERVIEAAKTAEADAVHPGFGFLAENADFATACTEAGLTFIGPSPEVIAQMGSKIAAKALAAEAGVPIIVGYAEARRDDGSLIAAAGDVGFPLIVKASAGGGGKGMRVVHDADALPEAIASARRESAAAFGDDSLLIERYIEAPRHIEIQILGDHHGNVVSLGERECSIQRRHQKIIEESPSTAVSTELRKEMGAAAVALGKAIGYTNAGTVEFILDQHGRFYFLEVNTRLQVEHPVTEAITGIDLVRQQICVARGEELDLGDVTIAGHAIECRLYAESPDDGFLPQAGDVVAFVPGKESVRIDTGIASGQTVSTHYDPMLAKIISHGRDRAEAIDRLHRTLTTLTAAGITTNRQFLAAILRHPAFVAGDTTTDFVETHLDELLTESATDERDRRRAAMTALLLDFVGRSEVRMLLRQLKPGFRTNPWGPQRAGYLVGGESLVLAYDVVDHHTLAVAGEPEVSVRLAGRTGNRLRVDIAGVRRSYRAVATGAGWWIHDLSSGQLVAVEKVPRFPSVEDDVATGACVAPMPGRVVKVAVAEGDVVEAGAMLVVMEAMKMEHTISAAEAGTVTTVRVAEGDQVDGGQLLVVIEPE